MKLLFKWDSLMSSNGVCIRSAPLTGDVDDFVTFFQWDALIEREISMCAKEKKGGEKKFERLGKNYFLKIIRKKGLNFEYEIFEVDSCITTCN